MLFCCRQTVEKLLKSLIARRSGEIPLPLHNLIRLAEIAGIALSAADSEYPRELTSDYIQTRYPDEIRKMSARVSNEKARHVMTKKHCAPFQRNRGAIPCIQRSFCSGHSTDIQHYRKCSSHP